MEQTITAKVQVYVPAEVNTLLNNTMNTYSKACNFVSEYIFKTHTLNQAETNQVL